MTDDLAFEFTVRMRICDSTNSIFNETCKEIIYPNNRTMNKPSVLRQIESLTIYQQVVREIVVMSNTHNQIFYLKIENNRFTNVFYIFYRKGKAIYMRDKLSYNVFPFNLGYVEGMGNIQAITELNNTVKLVYNTEIDPIIIPGRFKPQHTWDEENNHFFYNPMLVNDESVYNDWLELHCIEKYQEKVKSLLLAGEQDLIQQILPAFYRRNLGNT
jgi:hypothetical protein